MSRTAANAEHVTKRNATDRAFLGITLPASLACRVREYARRTDRSSSAVARIALERLVDAAAKNSPCREG